MYEQDRSLLRSYTLVKYHFQCKNSCLVSACIALIKKYTNYKIMSYLCPCTQKGPSDVVPKRECGG